MVEKIELDAQNLVRKTIKDHLEAWQLNWGKERQIEALSQKFFEEFAKMETLSDSQKETTRGQIRQFLEDYIKNYIIFSKNVIRRFLKKSMPSWQEAKIIEEVDVINQNLWTEMPQKLASFHCDNTNRPRSPQNDAFMPWLSVTARNYAIDYIRKEERLKKTLDSHLTDNGDNPLDSVSDSRSYGDCSYNCDYTLDNVILVFDELSKSNMDPVEILETKDLIARIYVALELSAFGKNWKKAQEKMDAELAKKQFKNNLPTYLLGLFLEGNGSLSYHLAMHEDKISLEKKYYPHIIRKHILRGVGYEELSNELEVSKDNVKDNIKKAVLLFQEILQEKFHVDLKQYMNWRVSIRNIWRIVLKILGCDSQSVRKKLKLPFGENTTKAVMNLLLDAIEMDKIAQEETTLDKILRDYWKECFCAIKSKEWKYCWRYLDKILEEYYQNNASLNDIFEAQAMEKEQKCHNFAFADFKEFECWFCNLQNDLKLVLQEVGIPWKEDIVYYLWKAKK